MQRKKCEMPVWMRLKLELRLRGKMPVPGRKIPFPLCVLPVKWEGSPGPTPVGRSKRVPRSQREKKPALS